LRRVVSVAPSNAVQIRFIQMIIPIADTLCYGDDHFSLSDIPLKGYDLVYFRVKKASMAAKYSEGTSSRMSAS